MRWWPIAVVVAWLLPAVAAAGTKSFDHPRFSFSFNYEDSWIPRVNTDGESVTFALEAGEILISVERARNPKRYETADEFANALMEDLRERVVFDRLDTEASRVAGEKAVLINGRGRLFDDPAQPYRAAIYVAQRGNRFYIVKYTGYYERTREDFGNFQSMVTSLRFKEKER